jgi:hypothetical protein
MLLIWTVHGETDWTSFPKTTSSFTDKGVHTLEPRLFPLTVVPLVESKSRITIDYKRISFIEHGRLYLTYICLLSHGKLSMIFGHRCTPKQGVVFWSQAGMSSNSDSTWHWRQTYGSLRNQLFRRWVNDRQGDGCCIRFSNGVWPYYELEKICQMGIYRIKARRQSLRISTYLPLRWNLTWCWKYGDVWLMESRAVRVLVDEGLKRNVI